MSKSFNFKSKPATSVSKAPTQPKATAPAASTAAAQAVFNHLPNIAWLRESQLVRSTKNADSTIAPLPFSAPTSWHKVNDGSFPKLHKPSTRVTTWKALQVRAWMHAQAMA